MYVCLDFSPFLFLSLRLSRAAAGTNWHPAELNVPSAESQMALAEGWREQRTDATERGTI